MHLKFLDAPWKVVFIYSLIFCLLTNISLVLAIADDALWEKIFFYLEENPLYLAKKFFLSGFVILALYLPTYILLALCLHKGLSAYKSALWTTLATFSISFFSWGTLFIISYRHLSNAEEILHNYLFFLTMISFPPVLAFITSLLLIKCAHFSK